MIRISGLGAKNFRSLKVLQKIKFKPINILVGRNSAGKSSFARLLPLLKQSSERRKRSPILWWGRLVDFGTFEDVYSTNSSDGFIDITVLFDLSRGVHLSRRPYYREPELRLTTPSEIEATFRLGKADDGTTQLRELHLKVFEVSVELVFAIDGDVAVKVNGRLQSEPDNIRLTWSQGQLMPLLRTVNVVSGSQTSAVSDEALFSPRRVARFGATRARSAVALFLHGNTQEDRKEEIVDRLPIAPLADLLAYCRSFPNATVTWKSIFVGTTAESASLRQLQASVVLYKLDLLLIYLDDAAQRHLQDVSYLEPLRATAQRYYRREEISTEELDPKGLNTPFFIQGLAPRERESLQHWTIENFGFSLSIRNLSGHLSLTIQPAIEGSVSRNMADVGLGYSQLVPVAIQLWAARNRIGSAAAVRRAGTQRGLVERGSRTVVVEQPELHLHPAYQARLADVFSIATRRRPEQPGNSPAPLTIIAETHSPNLIARIGELIIDGTLNAEDVQVLVFEDAQDPADGTKVRIATFNDQGVLTNWPIGFFDA
jgi:hypothetical protein